MIHDVIIAGGGPVGLFLACELRLRRVSVLVLERMRDPHSPLKAGWMGMRGLNIPSVEAFYRRGLLEAMRKSSLLWINPGNQSNPSQSAPRPRFGGHFGGIMLDASKIDFSRQKYTIPGPSAAGGMISLEALELLLAERAREWGVVLRQGIEVTGFTEDEEGIVAHAGEESFRAQWLVGCDGGRSTVRKCAGFEFAGTDPELTGHT
ncbi:MAG: FAD-dependent monooxygenase, partial [Bryobacteraceae bacterium]